MIRSPTTIDLVLGGTFSRWERTVLDDGSFNALPTVAVHAHELIEFDEAIP